MTSPLYLRILVPVSVVLIFAALQLFERTVFSPSHQQPSFPSPIGEPETGRYRLVQEYAGPSFFDNFDFEDGPDPTHGHVRYESRSAAVERNLTYFGLDGLSYIHTDHSERAPSGRRSVRISSKAHFTRGLFVLDVAHMPEGCGTWPAFWTTAPTGWPDKGEIDILEGVNLETDNAFTLHTSAGCRMPQYRAQRGSTESTDCDVRAPDQWANQGCGVKTVDSFGAKFNEHGGAVVVMEWTRSVIRMWIFPKDDGRGHGRASVPFDLSVHAPRPDIDTDAWGLPAASFPHDACEIERFFRDHVLVINTTLCGDWAGDVFAGSACPGIDCRSFVSEHPEAFEDAYWAIRSLRVYQTA